LAKETCHCVLAKCIGATENMNAKAMASHLGFRGGQKLWYNAAQEMQSNLTKTRCPVALHMLPSTAGLDPPRAEASREN
jgi:hypothetical protein